MTTTLINLRDSLKDTYYQRDWAKALPTLPAGWKEKTEHIAGLTLPFVGILYQPASRAISYASTSLNSLSSLYQIYSAKALSKEHVWNVVKNGAEFVGTLAGIRIGLGVHTAMNLGENLLSFRTFKTLTWSQAGEKMIPVVSNGLYLATLFSFSKKVSYAVMGASLLFQACLSAYQAQKAGKQITSWKDIKIFDTAAYAALSGIFLVKAHACYQPDVAKRFKDGDMLIAQMTPDENGDLKVTLLERVSRRQPSPQARAPTKTDVPMPPTETPSGKTGKAASASDPSLSEKALQERIKGDEQKARDTFDSFRAQYRQPKMPQQNDSLTIAEAMAQLSTGSNTSFYSNLKKLDAL